MKCYLMTVLGSCKEFGKACNCKNSGSPVDEEASGYGYKRETQSSACKVLYNLEFLIILHFKEQGEVCVYHYLLFGVPG